MRFHAYHYSKFLSVRSDLANGIMYGLFRCWIVAFTSIASVDHLNTQLGGEAQGGNKARNAGWIGQVHGCFHRDRLYSCLFQLLLDSGDIVTSGRDKLAHARDGG